MKLGMFIATLFFTVFIWGCIFLLVGGVVTSGVKSLSGDCGKTYPVERVVAGDWFCVEGKDNE